MQSRERVIKYVEVSAVCMWVLAILHFWMRSYQAKTAEQASTSDMWLAMVAFLGLLWFVLRTIRGMKSSSI
jgi:hypothetical protein